ncbi:YihY/virulence factor BrkB family protein [Microbacterium koreense]|uniref:YihY/virulence factor BrkB family protein n=1 Tax=Microbacterium koreense TaxID=323761 RepID=A0ABW2ZPG2_9MICO
MPEVTDPDDPVKASSPTQLRGQTWRYLLRRTVREFLRDECVDTAGALTFFGVLAVFPAGLAIMALVGIVADRGDVRDRILTLLSEVAPTAVIEVAESVLVDVTESATADFTLIVAVVVALWSASAYVSAFGRAVNRIYGTEEGRPYWKRKPLQLALTVLLLVLVIIAAILVVISGPLLRTLGGTFGLGDVAIAVWNVVRWPILAAAVVVLVAVLYKGTGNLKLPRFRWLSLGALVAIVVMGIASLGFGFYVSNFATYNQTFGAFAGVIIFLIWLFLINAALLLGVEFNAEIERGRQLQAGIPAERQLHLPSRDTRQIERSREADRITEERGAMLRDGKELPSARPDSPIAQAKAWFSSAWDHLRGR